MNKLNELITLCKCGIYIRINAHKDSYQTIDNYFNSPSRIEDKEDIETTVYDIMLKTNTIVEVQCYPDTPVGSYIIYHYDIDIAIDNMIATIK